MLASEHHTSDRIELALHIQSPMTSLDILLLLIVELLTNGQLSRLNWTLLGLTQTINCMLRKVSIGATKEVLNWFELVNLLLIGRQLNLVLTESASARHVI